MPTDAILPQPAKRNESAAEAAHSTSRNASLECGGTAAAFVQPRAT